MSEFKETEHKRKTRKKKNYLLRFFIFVCICVGLGFFAASDFFTIDKLSAEGNSFYSDDEIINMANGKTGGNIFWGTGKSDIIDRLSSNPYFEEVKVERKLPNKIVIKVKERNQVAAIVYGDKYVVISQDGIVLRKSDIDPKLTLLTGLTISKLKMGEKVEAKEKENLKTTLNMLSAMKDGDIFFKKIVVTNVTISAYIYDNLLCKGTPKQMLKVIKNGDLQKVVNNLLQNKTTRGTITIGSNNYMSFSPNF